MKLIFVFLALQVIFAESKEKISSDCGTCGLNSNVACIDTKRFHPCYNGVPDTSQTLTCGDDTLCVDDTDVCISSSQASCKPQCSCNMCDSNGKYACLNSTSFAFCFGQSVPSSQIANCPKGQFCKLGTSFCTTEAEESSCAVEEAEPPATEPIKVCTGIGRTGKFALEGTNCRKYLRCLLINGQLVGEVTDCPYGTFFDAKSRDCIHRAAGFVCQYIRQAGIYDVLKYSIESSDNN